MKSLLLCLLSFIMGWNLYAQPVSIVTEKGPFSYEKDGKVAGEATEVVEEAFKRAQVEYTIKIYPWARAYKMAETDPNVLIYSMGRTAEREAKFKWVGSIIPIRYYLYKLKSREDIQLKTLEDAKAWSVGAVRDDVRHKYLIDKGFAPEKIQLVNNNNQNIEKLMASRIDLFPMSSVGIGFLCRDTQMDCATISPALALEDLASELHMAFSLGTADEMLAKVKKALESMKEDGTYQKIMGAYLQVN